MWTRIKEHLHESSIDPHDAIYICGAAHAASYVPEFGLASEARWEVPPRTSTTWLYGLLPSSYSAICHQFGHPRGAVTLAEARWRKSLARQSLRAFALGSRHKKSSAEVAAKAPKRKSRAAAAAPQAA
jgi:hypothetical protein